MSTCSFSGWSCASVGSVADRPRALIGAAIMLVAGVAASACSRGDAPGLTVFAAASMTVPMQRLVADFERAHPGTTVRLHCAGTPRLVMQIRAGADVDVFVAADEASMASVRPRPRPQPLASNRLAIVVAKGNPKGISGLGDLARDDLLVALCGPNVPAGRYARAACASAGVAVVSVSDEPNVRALLTKVRLGELDAGVVYETDVVGAAGVDAVAIPPAFNVRAIYPVARLSERPEAIRFLDYLTTAAAREILRSSGFGAP